MRSRCLPLDLDHQKVGAQALESSGNYESKRYSKVSTRLGYNMPQFSDLKLWVGAIWYPGDLYSEFAFSLYDQVYTNPNSRLQVQTGFSLAL